LRTPKNRYTGTEGLAIHLKDREGQGSGRIHKEKGAVFIGKRSQFAGVKRI